MLCYVCALLLSMIGTNWLCYVMLCYAMLCNVTRYMAYEAEDTKSNGKDQKESEEAEVGGGVRSTPHVSVGARPVSGHWLSEGAVVDGAGACSGSCL